MPQRIDDDWGALVAWKQSESKTDMAKCKLLNVMLAHGQKHDVGPEDVLLCLKPTGLRAMRNMLKGAIGAGPVRPPGERFHKQW